MQKKKGITLSALATMVVVMVILSSAAVVSVKKISDNSKLRTFATEFAMVNDELKLKQKEDINFVNDAIMMDLSGVSEDILENQFKGEDINNNNIVVYKVNIDDLGFNNSTYGKGTTTKDIYAVSKNTGRVYYIEGIKANGTTYYTLTEELEQAVGIKYDITNINKQIVFKPSHIDWTSEAIKTEIIIPVDFDNISISTNLEGTNSENISNIEQKEGKYVAIANIGEKKSNYTITVTYTNSGESKTETFEVNNYDGTKPTLSYGEFIYKVSQSETEIYLPNILAEDNESGILKIKYEKDKISEQSAKQYFNKGGKNIENETLKIDENVRYYTLYVEDKAGNFSIHSIFNPEGEI